MEQSTCQVSETAGQSRRIPKGFKEVTEPSTTNTEADLEAGRKTKAVDVAQKAEEAGIDPSGKTTEKLKKNFQKKRTEFDTESLNSFTFIGEPQISFCSFVNLLSAVALHQIHFSYIPC